MDRVGKPDATNTHILSPSHHLKGRDRCSGLVPVTKPSNTSLMGVLLSQSPDQFISSFRDDLPPEMTIIDVSSSTRSSTKVANAESSGKGGRISIQPVKSPGNLTKLGVAMVNCFEEFEADADEDEILMCFEDVNSLIPHSDSRRVGQFFQQLSTYVREYGVTAHYQADPTTLNPGDINRLKLHVDAVVKAAETGELTVRTR